MLKILLPFDGSNSALHAVQYAVKLSQSEIKMEVYLLNVQEQPAIELSPALLTPEMRQNYHLQEGEKICRSAQTLLSNAHIAYQLLVEIGNVAEIIALLAKEKGCDAIIMGTRGISRLANLLMGSVAYKVVHLSEVPVVLIK